MVRNNYKTLKGIINHSAKSGFSVSILEFLKQPNLVGSAFPSSTYLTDILLESINWEKFGSSLNMDRVQALFPAPFLKG